IQLIVSNHKYAIDLIKDFDMPVVRAYYDGELFHPTVGALYDWLNMKISLYTYYNIKASRLYNMHWKGFELSEEAQVFLKNTIGWPPEKEYEDSLQFNIPFISSNVPIEVQFANLYAQFKLIHYDDTKEAKKEEETK